MFGFLLLGTFEAGQHAVGVDCKHFATQTSVTYAACSFLLDDNVLAHHLQYTVHMDASYYLQLKGGK